MQNLLLTQSPKNVYSDNIFKYLKSLCGGTHKGNLFHYQLLVRALALLEQNKIMCKVTIVF